MDKKEKKAAKKKEPMTKGDKVSLIVGIVLCVILVPILIFNTVSIVQSLVTDKPPAIGKYTMMVVSTNSMTPLFSKEDVIIVESVDPDTIEVGDVITYFEEGNHDSTPVTHRVIKIEEKEGQRYATTAGDANARNDYKAALAANGDDEVERNHTESITKTFVDEKAPLDENGEKYTYVTYGNSFDSKLVKLDKDTVIGRYTYKEAPKQIVAFTDFMRSPWAWVCFVIIPLAALIAVELILKNKRDKKKAGDMNALLAELEALKAAKAAETNAAPAPEAVEPEAPKAAEDAPKDN